MKRLIIIALCCSLLLTSGCAAYCLLKPQIEMAIKSPAELYPTPTPESALLNGREVTQFESYFTSTQKFEMNELNEKYGIDIWMNAQWQTDENYTHSDIAPAQYAEIIDNVSEAIFLLNELGDATAEINQYINALSFFDVITVDGVDRSWLASTEAEGYYIIDYATASNSRELAARLLSIIAYTTANEEALAYHYFSNINANGFYLYDDQLPLGALSYRDCLASYGITDPEDIQIECLKAGFLTPESTESIRADFAEYIYQSISPNHSFWWAYGNVNPIQTKIESALQYMGSLHPAWCDTYIIVVFNPEYGEILYYLSSDLNSTYYLNGAVYSGTYQNTSGTMNAELIIDSIDNESGKINARFVFSPADGNTIEKSGEYALSGYVDFTSNSLSLQADHWISAVPEGYNMLDINGVLFATKLSGEFNRDKNIEIVLDRNPDSYMILAPK